MAEDTMPVTSVWLTCQQPARDQRRGRYVPATGLLPVQRCAAMLAAVRDGQIVHRASMFGLMAVRRARAEGVPVHLIAHEDVLVLRR